MRNLPGKDYRKTNIYYSMADREAFNMIFLVSVHAESRNKNYINRIQGNLL